MEGREWSLGQSHKEEDRKGGIKCNREVAQGSLAEEGGLYLDNCIGVPDFLVMPLLMGPVFLISQGRCEEPVRRWRDHGGRHCI